MDASSDEKAAVAKAAELTDALKAACDDNDAEGLAARKAAAEFAASMAELDALMEDSDDEPLRAKAEAPKASADELLESNLERLERETAWQFRRVGLELQRPWASLVLDGTKTVETRSYPLPAALLGRPVAVLETQEGTAGSSALPDEVPADDPSVRLLGTVTFSSNLAYASHEEWLADFPRHRVPADSPYAWTKDRVVFGWVVGAAQPNAQPSGAPSLSRRLRSLFELDAPVP